MAIKNTTTEICGHQEARNFLMLGDNAIEEQEAAGQRELVNSTQLPVKVNSPHGVNSGTQYELMGIKVLESSEGDSLFVNVKLPNGWRLKATVHSMWNELIDNKNRTRATIFYKAAFYDRDAFINFERRFCVSSRFIDGDSKKQYYFVKDNITGKELYKSKLHEAYSEVDGLERARCLTKLENDYPDYENINKYWGM